MSEQPDISATVRKAFIPISRRMRLRLWWRRVRLGRAGRQLDDAFARHMDDLLLHGDTTGAPGRHSLSGEPMSPPPRRDTAQ